MLENLKALAVLLTFAVIIYVMVGSAACESASRREDFARRRALWFAVTIIAYFSIDFWLFMILAGSVLAVVSRRDPRPIAVYFALFMAVPPIEGRIGGLGLVEHLFTIQYPRLVVLTVLLPAFLAIRRDPAHIPFGRLMPDRLIGAYIGLYFLLVASSSTVTNALRHGIFYAFIDIFLPYYVASRTLRSIADFRDVLMAFAVAALVLSPVAVFEAVKGWLLYAQLDEVMEMQWITNFVARSDTLRAQGPTGMPIGFGLYMSIGATFLIFLRRSIGDPVLWVTLLGMVIAGMIATISRGPWVGFAVMLFMIVVTGPRPMRALVPISIAGVLFLPLLATPVGQTIIDHLPFIGSVESQNVTYRALLLEVSVDVILMSPFFGVFEYLLIPEMQVLKQGQGIIDVVNTYLGVALERGLVGLLLFVAFFATIGRDVLRGIQTAADPATEAHWLGRVLFGTLIGILTVIFTVSSILIVPYIYWAFAGLCVAYAQMMASGGTAQLQPGGQHEPK